MFLGDAGGCGFCPPAAPGIQGDRGSLGYRGRPGVSAHRKTLIDFLLQCSFISSLMEHPAIEVHTSLLSLNQHCLMMIFIGEKGDSGSSGPPGPSGLPGPDVKIDLVQ